MNPPTVAELLATATEHGVHLDVTPDGALTCRSASPPPPGFLEALRQSKAAVLDALGGRRYGQCPPPDLPLADTAPGLANPEETDRMATYALEGQPIPVLEWIDDRVDRYRRDRPSWSNADCEMSVALDLAVSQGAGIAPGAEFPVELVRLTLKHRPAQGPAPTP